MNTFKVIKLALTAGIFLLPNIGRTEPNVDFKNFKYDRISCEGIPKKATVKNGEFKKINKDYETSFSITNIIYGDINADGDSEALIVGECGLQGANYWPVQIFVYSIKNEQPKLIDTLTEDRMAHDYERFYPNGTLWQFGSLNYKNGNFIIERLADGPHCCPEHTVFMEYHLTGSKVAITGKPRKINFKQ